LHHQSLPENPGHQDSAIELALDRPQRQALEYPAILEVIVSSLEWSALRRNPRIEEAPLQGELMLFDPASSKFFVINATMERVWRGCPGASSPDEIVDQIVATFVGAERARVSGDVEQAIRDLISMGLLIQDGAVG
jgi:hypothetical protein